MPSTPSPAPLPWLPWRINRLVLAGLVVMLWCGGSVAPLRSLDDASARGKPDRLPGEFGLTTSYRLVDSRRDGRWLTRSRLPTISEVAERVALPQMEPLVILALHEDDSNHYVPSFSPDGRAVAFLTADIERRTAKQRIIEPRTGQREPHVIFAATPDSYDYMLSWGPWASRQRHVMRPFVLASQRRRGIMDLYMATSTEAEPGLLLEGREHGIPKHPALSGGWTAPKLAWEIAGEVWWGELQRPDSATATWRLKTRHQVGAGHQPEWSPGGEWLIFTRSPDSADYQTDGDRVVGTRVRDGETRTLVAATPGTRLRDPRLNAASDTLLVHRVHTNDPGRGAEIAVVDLDPDSLAPRGQIRSVVENVLVQPHFDFHPIATSPRGGLVMAFGEAADADGYNPIRWARIDGKTSGEIHHSDEFTTAQDIAVDPDPETATLAFSAVEGIAQGIFVIILNHWGEDDD